MSSPASITVRTQRRHGESHRSGHLPGNRCTALRAARLARVALSHRVLSYARTPYGYRVTAKCRLAPGLRCSFLTFSPFDRTTRTARAGLGSCGREREMNRAERGLYVRESCGVTMNVDVNCGANIRRKITRNPPTGVTSNGRVTRPAIHLLNQTSRVGKTRRVSSAHQKALGSGDVFRRGRMSTDGCTVTAGRPDSPDEHLNEPLSATKPGIEPARSSLVPPCERPDGE